jgi:uncharacterized repeat protein (TIGR03803 family)
MKPYLAILGIIVATRAFAAENVLWSFGSLEPHSDGCQPMAAPTEDSTGNLYGTTAIGGNDLAGTIFKLTPPGAESVLWSFGETTDGIGPIGPMIADSAGDLLGTTFEGGLYDGGTAFELAADGTESILWNFSNGKNGLRGDGRNPAAGLIEDADGNLYGTTEFGGPYYADQAKSGGTIFKLTPSGAESILWSFGKGSDGRYPVAGLIADVSGNLYGTTSSGGAHGAGTVFELTAAGTESVLWSFGGAGDGSTPAASLLMGASGSLYGTAESGGSFSDGIVFKLTPRVAKGTWSESILWNFGNGTDGAIPQAGLIVDNSGNLYGTTDSGGAYKLGTAFKLAASGKESVLWSFGNGVDGARPKAGLIMDSSGNLFGTASAGGTGACGVVFEIPKS